jgi:polyhydroxybutyrate depolymerase
MKLEQLLFDGYTREYVVSAPTSRRPLPTIIALHGTFLDAQRMTVSMGLEPLVDREGLVVVYPNAVAAQWNDGRPVAAAWSGGVDDVEFIRSLVEHLVRTGVSDPHQVYVTGFSSGGMMTLRLMCEAPELIAAAALIGASFPVELVESCEARLPTPILMMNGTADPVVPYAGGAVVFGGGQVLSTDETINFMRTVNRCADRVNFSELPDIDPDDGSHVIVASWTKCASTAPVVLYRIEGGGHRIPSRREDWPVADILLGRMNHDFEAPYAIWNFFKDKKRATGTIATSAGAPHG